MTNSTVCSICSETVKEFPVSGDFRHYTWKRCGTFKVSQSAAARINSLTTQDSPLAASLGHWVQDQQRFGRDPLLTIETVEQHNERPFFPDIATQLANFIRVMGNNMGEPGPIRCFDAATTQFKVGCKTFQGLVGLAKHLNENGQIDVKGGSISASGSVTASLTVAGWIEYEKILTNSNVGRKAFIAMPFGKPDLDEEWVPKLRTAVEQTGYILERVDDNPEPGLIDTRMKLQIKAARFLLVELTHGNHGAYWEARLAEGLGKPVIYLRRSDDGTKTHFDVEHAFRVSWDADNMTSALETVKATIRNTMPDAIMTDGATDTGK